MERIAWSLQYFAGEGAEAAGAPDAGGMTGPETAAGTGTESAPIRQGDTLPDGTTVPSARVAAALERQMARHPELRQVYGQGQAPGAEGNPQGAGNPPTEQTIQQRWDELKKGEFKELYGRDVKAAIDDRFKNQSDAAKQLKEIQPMLDALMQISEVDNLKDLSDIILNDDRLYEEEAERRGMTVEAYKRMKVLEEEHEARQKQDAENQQQAMFRQHIQGLVEQGEKLKEIYPDFDLNREMENETFRRLTAPGSGLSVEDAYFAVHRKELGPQMMMYGMNRARQQMSQTIQAQRQRPVEGAMRSNASQAAEMKLNPANMTRKERDRIRQLIHKGSRVSFD